MIDSEQWEAGLGTTPGMWEMVSEALVGEKLPVSINLAIEMLCNGTAMVVAKQPPVVSSD